MKIFTTLILSLTLVTAWSQTLDEELGFIYVKADYLMETGRYDEAIKEFTKIIAKDPNFRDAMFKRADAKYNVGAYQGTYNDVLTIFENKGVSPWALELFGKAQKALGKIDASEMTLETHSQIGLDSGPTRSSDANSSDSDSGSSTRDQVNDAAKDIKDQISDILRDILPGSNADEEVEEDTGSTGTDSTSGGNTGSDSGSTRSQTKGGTEDRGTTTDSSSGSDDPVIFQPKPEEPEVPEIDDSINEIYIDEDLTLEIKNGLGARKILQQPSILMLSETSGIVVIDLCVNSNGKVNKASFNAAESTLDTQAIISLAERKSKEFWFKSSTSTEMCGSIYFNITGH